MRIYFELDEVPEGIIDGDDKEYSFWIKDFPCRVIKKDTFTFDIIPNEEICARLRQCCSIIKVAETMFKSDKKGIYQHVWSDVII